MAQIIAETTCPQCGAELKVWLEPCDFHVHLPDSASQGQHTEYCAVCGAAITFTVQFAQTIDYWIDDADPVEVEVAA